VDDKGRLRFSLFLQAFAIVMFTGAGLVRGFALGFDALTWILLGAGAISGVIAALTFIQYRDD
jgi:aspartyl-tRNA synthetase